MFTSLSLKPVLKIGLKGVAQQLRYDWELVAVSEGGAARFGSLRSGERLWARNQSVQQRLRLHSDFEAFKVLSSEIEQENTASCATLRCGMRLWSHQVAIHTTIAKDDRHRVIRAELEILESLVPAHWQVDLRYV